MAEKNLAQVRSIAKSEFTAHTLNTNIRGSAAERNIRRYKEGQYSVKEGQTCWGCGKDNYPYAIRGRITCQNKDKPGVAKAADRKRKAYNEGNSKYWAMRRKISSIIYRFSQGRGIVLITWIS